MNRITPINMSDPLVLKEGNMQFSAPNSHTNTTTYTGSTAIGCQIAYRTAINIDNVKKITYRLNLGICYGGGSHPTRERFWYRVGVMRDIPTSFMSGETSQDFGYLAVNEYTDANTDYGEEELDLSNVTGTVYLVLMCHGWTSEIDDIGCLMRIKAQGDIRAIGDWFRSTRYLKEEINEFFILQNSYTPYIITIIGTENSVVTITGQTSGRSYNIELVSGERSKLLFFTTGETIVATDGTKVVTKVLDEHYININLIPYSETVLWDYVNDNNNSILYGSNTFSATLHDSVENYDTLIIELIRYYTETAIMFSTVPVITLTEGRNPGRFALGVNQNGWSGRSASFSVQGTNFQKVADTYGNYQNSMGLVKVIGIKTGCRTELLWDYLIENNGNVSYDYTALTLRDSINNFDEIVIEYVSNETDITDQDQRWNAGWINSYPVEGINNAWNPNYIWQTSHSDRMSAFYIADRTIRRKSNNQSGNKNGIAKVWGVKY